MVVRRRPSIDPAAGSAAGTSLFSPSGIRVNTWFITLHSCAKLHCLLSAGARKETFVFNVCAIAPPRERRAPLNRREGGEREKRNSCTRIVKARRASLLNTFERNDRPRTMRDFEAREARIKYWEVKHGAVTNLEKSLQMSLTSHGTDTYSVPPLYHH